MFVLFNSNLTSLSFKMGKILSNRQLRMDNERKAQMHYDRILRGVETSAKYKTNKRIARMRIKYSHLETLNKKNTDDI